MPGCSEVTVRSSEPWTKAISLLPPSDPEKQAMYAKEVIAR